MAPGWEKSAHIPDGEEKVIVEKDKKGEGVPATLAYAGAEDLGNPPMEGGTGFGLEFCFLYARVPAGFGLR